MGKLDSKVDSVQITGKDGKGSSLPKQQQSSVSAESGGLVHDATDSGSSHMMTSDHLAKPTNANMVKAGLGADPTKPKAKKAKELRKERALAKMKATGKVAEKSASSKMTKKGAKTVEELTSLEFPANSRHKFEIRLVSAQTSDANFNESYLDSYNVYKKCQVKIHKDSPSKCSLGQFKRFLCNSSMIRVPYPGLTDGHFGAFHQQYIIDGRIIAVGVIDILPHCVSSVYLYYDPDFSFLSPGTLTSLLEI